MGVAPWSELRSILAPRAPSMHPYCSLAFAEFYCATPWFGVEGAFADGRLESDLRQVLCLMLAAGGGVPTAGSCRPVRQGQKRQTGR